jgi:hypothetical protein
MFFVSPSTLLTAHKNQSTRMLSQQLWARAYGQGYSPDGDDPLSFVYDDFKCFSNTTAVAANVGRYAGQVGYLSYEDTGNAITQLATEADGVIKITTDTTDNDESWLQPGMATSVLGKVAVASSPKLVLFETRIKVGQIGNTYNAFFGLSEEGLAAADTFTDAGAMGDKDFLGFWVLEGAGSALKFGWRKSGQAVVSLGTAKTLVADTWYKVGFCYDPKAKPSQRLSFYVDNEVLSTYGTATQLAAATFPDGEELNLLLGVKNGTASANFIESDWWAFGQAG